MKIGLFGGTFDPIHLGHLFIADWIRESLELKKVILIPAAQPPHKLNVKITDKIDRWNMVTLAVRDNRAFEVSDVEIKNDEISYTVDTLRKFSKKDDEIYFIIGEDSLKDLNIWKDPEEIFRLSKIIVANRVNYSAFNKNNIYGDKVIYSGTPEISISSTQIRERVRDGKSIKYFVHPAVEEYILKKGLYKNS